MFHGIGKIYIHKLSWYTIHAIIANYEVFIINDQIEQSILGGNVAESDIKHIAVDDGVVTMEQDGVLKAMDGMTSIEEVFRVI